MSAPTERAVYPPERKVQKILVALPQDQVAMIDDCAKAMGMSRSSFLHIFFDAYSEKIIDFVEGWLTGIKYYIDKETRQSKLREAKKASRTLGFTLQGGT